MPRDHTSWRLHDSNKSNIDVLHAQKAMMRGRNDIESNTSADIQRDRVTKERE